MNKYWNATYICEILKNNWKSEVMAETKVPKSSCGIQQFLFEISINNILVVPEILHLHVLEQ